MELLWYCLNMIPVASLWLPTCQVYLEYIYVCCIYEIWINISFLLSFIFQLFLPASLLPCQITNWMRLSGQLTQLSINKMSVVAVYHKKINLYQLYICWLYVWMLYLGMFYQCWLYIIFCILCLCVVYHILYIYCILCLCVVCQLNIYLLLYLSLLYLYLNESMSILLMLVVNVSILSMSVVSWPVIYSSVYLHILLVYESGVSISVCLCLLYLHLFYVFYIKVCCSLLYLCHLYLSLLYLCWLYPSLLYLCMLYLCLVSI